MTLILKLYLDMVKMYLHTKNEVSMSSGSKVIAWTDRNTDRQTDRQTHTHTHTHTNRHTDRQTDRHDWKHYLPAYAGGNDILWLIYIAGDALGYRIRFRLQICWLHCTVQKVFQFTQTQTQIPIQIWLSNHYCTHGWISIPGSGSEFVSGNLNKLLKRMG